MQITSQNATERFSDRVENYIKYRPSYPTGLIDLLKHACGLSKSSAVADIGSGTGIFATSLLPHAKTVYGVEPNREMREAAERLLGSYPNFKSIPAPAEDTTLEPRSIDLITVAQAFHWFDPHKTRTEFVRILKPGGWTALIWNERLVDATPFLRAYEDLLLRFATDYDQVDHRRIDESIISTFFNGNKVELATFENCQRFNEEGLRGRLFSSSYAPSEGHSNHKPMMESLSRIFATHAVNGLVSFDYKTKVFYGQFCS